MKNQMLNRFVKAISVPIAALILLIPMTIIQGIVWIIVGKKTPIDRVDEYFEWLQGDNQ